MDSRDVLVHDGVVVTHDAEPGPLLGVAPVLQGLPHHRGAAGGGAVTGHTRAQSGALKPTMKIYKCLVYFSLVLLLDELIHVKEMLLTMYT